MSAKTNNSYLQKISITLPRILALFDTDATSPTYGQGDRYRWAWKLIDFGNGTFQGTAHGLARLLKHDVLPEYLSTTSVLKRIDAMFYGADRLRRSNGSMEEAFPYESSFCVTALVAYDLLSAIDLLEGYISAPQRTQYLEIVRPMIDFLHHVEETHAFISNHLATAATAMYKWTALTGEPGQKRGRELLDRILQEQSEEGWFREYEGADPGYQSLCTYYLADIYQLYPDEHLFESLRRSLQFLWYFAHPDGSFGGYYGSRNTRLYYPAGIEFLAAKIPEANALAQFLRKSITYNTTVTLETMDEPNLIPMFNAYCWAAVLYEQTGDAPEEVRREIRETPLTLPCVDTNSWRKIFPEAGFVVEKRPQQYTIISWHKGGVCYHFHGENTTIDSGVVARNHKDELYSTQAYQPENQVTWEKDRVQIVAPLVKMHKQVPTPWQFLFLRLLNTTLMRHRKIGNLIKKFLVEFLITGNIRSIYRNCRTITWEEGQLRICDNWDNECCGFEKVSIESPFSAIHMASQGYWQRQDKI